VERLRRRLQRYRQHHEASRCRYDNHINSTADQQHEQTRLLHKRWLQSQYSVPQKSLKLSVVDETITASSVADLRTSQSLVRTVLYILNVQLCTVISLVICNIVNAHFWSKTVYFAVFLSSVVFLHQSHHIQEYVSHREIWVLFWTITRSALLLPGLVVI